MALLAPALFIPLSFGADSPDPAPGDRAAAAEKFLADKLAIWQKRLKLDDWRLSIRMVPSGELKPKTLGNIHWDTPTKTAAIRVLRLTEYKLPEQEALRDMEFTVVHELVHLQLASLPRSDASRGAEEHAVNRLAEALLQLDRKQ